ncbi:3,4-dioxygenase subunit beta [Arthrobacter sp. SW1]|uniref:intradiol ring-cleavage dioxygenase n=1 Tax=Arthrobacter sp. SW1 TaxID=1920889 RepID=UPI000877E6A3|nr:intradiol ring-cleavage dioxygenase [Arthrobacter sp. SW1]OFI36531.1 3,4-dioxygenase subunit beta [Arthrobacter sp. SW1]
MTTSSNGPENGPHPDHDRGLEFDLSTLLSRRRTLGVLFGGAATAALAACTPAGSGGTPSASTSSSAASTTAAASPSSSASPSASASSGVTRAFAECGVEIPQETAGPYPGDGSNGPNVLEASGVVRKDITSSFGTSSTKAEGVPLTVTLTLLDNSNGCVPLAGAAVYAWHCDREGRYSLYDSGLENENFLRGVQEADANGQLTFTTIFPGAYNGRWPHIHFEVFESLSNATSAGQLLAVSQIALTDAACRDVYATAGYETSARNFPNTTLQSDNVFGDDGGVYQLAAMSGSASAGYTAALNVTI